MIPYGKHHLDEQDFIAVREVLSGNSLTQGPAIESFEEALAAYVGAKFAVAVSSGTAALHLAALAAGAKDSTSIVTSPITFVASANAANYVGAKVVLADICPDTINISPDALANALENNPDTRVVIPVHFAGLPCNMAKIRSLADGAGASVIEDGCHALGSKYDDGQMVGCCANSLMTTFSFHPVKAIAAGEGGVITTNNEEIYRKLLRLRSHGINKLNDEFVYKNQAETSGVENPWYYEMQDLGYNYRLTDIQAALAQSQLSKIDKFIARRKELAHRYDDFFKTFDLLRPAQSNGRKQSAHHIYTIRCDFEAIGKTRAEVMLTLRDEGVITQVHYIPVHYHPYFKEKFKTLGNFPNAEKYYDEALTIPLFYGLKNEQQDFVIDLLRGLIS